MSFRYKHLVEVVRKMAIKFANVFSKTPAFVCHKNKLWNIPTIALITQYTLFFAAVSLRFWSGVRGVIFFFLVHISLSWFQGIFLLVQNIMATRVRNQDTPAGNQKLGRCYNHNHGFHASCKGHILHMNKNKVRLKNQHTGSNVNTRLRWKDEHVRMFCLLLPSLKTLETCKTMPWLLKFLTLKDCTGPSCTQSLPQVVQQHASIGGCGLMWKTRIIWSDKGTNVKCRYVSLILAFKLMRWKCIWYKMSMEGAELMCVGLL